MALGLRGRFTLGFGVAAIVTIAAAALITRYVVSSRYRAEFERTLRAAEADAQREVRGLQGAVVTALDSFATRENFIVGAVLVDLRAHEGELSGEQRRELKRRGADAMRALGLDVLMVVDARGTVLAAPHFDAAVDEVDPLPRRVAGLKGGGPVLVWTRQKAGGGIARVPVMAAARTVSDGPVEVTVLVGRVAGAPLTEALHRDGVVEARLTDGDGKQLATTEPDWDGRLRGAPAVDVPLPGVDGAVAAHLLVAVPSADLKRTLDDVTLATAAFGILAVLVAVALGFVVARRITGDVDALVAGAQAVSRGDLAHRVEVRAKHDEIGELAAAFNHMTSELADSKEKLVQAERVAAWQDIARSIAHEIKNPLTPIQMSVETLRKTWSAKHPSFEEIFEESTRTVLEEVARLKRIVSEFSQFARLPKPAMQPLDLDEVAAAAITLYKGAVRVVSELAENLPPVSADRDQLTQVILNLLENARDAVASRGSDQSVGRITVRTRRADGLVELEVEDNGPGFDPAIREKLFEPYFTTKTGGTGLGLAIARRIVTEHGGKISATSEPGRGARFVVELPARG